MILRQPSALTLLRIWLSAQLSKDK